MSACRGKPAAAAALIVLLAFQSLSAELHGTVTAVHDGDTLTLATGQKIRLYGIDAPELHQKCLQGGACVPCGERARAALVALTAGRILTCTPRGRSYARIVAECSMEGQSLDLAMIEAGQAIPYWPALRNAQKPAFQAAQDRAKASKAGIWAMSWVSPDRWRKGDRLACER